MEINKSNTISMLAYVVIIVAGLSLGASIILPFLMAFFLFIIFLPLVKKLDEFGLSNGISTFFVLTIIVISIMILVDFLTNSTQDFMINIPMYQVKFQQSIPNIIDFFKQYNISLNLENLISLIEPMNILSYSTIIFTNMGNIVVNIFLTLLLLMFLLLESSIIFDKAIYFTKTQNKKDKLEQFVNSINRYFVIKTFTSALTGFLIWGLLEYYNLEYALFFAVLAFLLNYIPSIGAFIAGFPPLFVAVLQLSVVDSVSIAIGYLVINVFIGSFLDPKIMGKDLGLSTFIVFISMVIWGWILGPIGMFLAVPLTIVIKIICEDSDNYHWVSVILQDKQKIDS